MTSGEGETLPHPHPAMAALTGPLLIEKTAPAPPARHQRQKCQDRPAGARPGGSRRSLGWPAPQHPPCAPRLPIRQILLHPWVLLTVRLGPRTRTVWEAPLKACEGQGTVMTADADI